MTKDLRQVVLASGNQGKLREFQHLLGALDIEMLPQSDFQVEPVEETGLTFVEKRHPQGPPCRSHFQACR